MVNGLLVPDNTTQQLTDHVIASIAENLPFVKTLPNPAELYRTAYRVMLPAEMADSLGYKGDSRLGVTYRFLIHNYGHYLYLERSIRKVPFLCNVLIAFWSFLNPVMKTTYRALVYTCWILSIIYKKLNEALGRRRVLK